MIGSVFGFPSSVFDEFNRLRADLDEIFEPWPRSTSIRAVARGTFPMVNVGGSPESVDVYVLAPGIDPKSLNVTVQQNVLTVSGERPATIPEKESTRVYLAERFAGKFQRSVTLPDDCDPDQVQARYENGVLQVTIRRHDAARPRQIEVK